MERIDLSQPNPKRRITALSYGASRSGKTRFAGTWPRPLFLSDASEGGWETLRTMADEDLYEPGKRPDVWALHSARDMLQALDQLEIDVRAGKYRTIVVDSLTFYADSYFAALEQAQVAGDKKRDPRQLYGDLASHLRYLMIRVHNLPCNVLWLCLDKPPTETTPGGPLLAGQSADKAPARCDYYLYHRSTTVGQGLVFEVRTKRFGGYPAGGRDGGALPDPMEPTFRSLEEALGLMAHVKPTPPGGPPTQVARRSGNGAVLRK